jgi:hypothetical protein
MATARFTDPLTQRSAGKIERLGNNSNESPPLECMPGLKQASKQASIQL